ncbi:MAG: transposase, partial [Defluviicoccus sp.]
YHSYMIAELRLMLEVEVQAGNKHGSNHSAPGLWALLTRLGRENWPCLLRGDCGWGTEANMSRAEQEGLPYLFKLRLTRNANRLINRAMTEPGWLSAGHGWQGKEGNLRLQGWSRHRRVILLRRPIERTVAVIAGDGSGRQLDLYFGDITADPAAKAFEYAVLVTSLADEVLTVAQLYRDRATGENNFDELKKHWGWGGFTTRDLPRCRLMARIVALIYNWWSLFVRLADPNQLDRSDHQPAAVAPRRRPADPARQSDHNHHHQHARQGRPCSPHAGRGRDLLQVAAANSGAVERPPTMVPNPQPGPGQVPQGPSARTAARRPARLISPAKRENRPRPNPEFTGQLPDLG